MKPRSYLKTALRMKIALRNLIRHRVYAAINILGLTVAMTCCILIVIYVRHELSFDDHLANADRIYRVHWGDENLQAGPLATTLAAEMPQIEATPRLRCFRPLLTQGDTRLCQSFAFADPTVFELFSIDLVAGVGTRP